MVEKDVDKGLNGKEVLWRKSGLCNNKNNYKTKLANINETLNQMQFSIPHYYKPSFFNATSLT